MKKYTIISVMILVVIIIIRVVYSTFGNIKYIKIDKSDEALGISKEPETENKEYLDEQKSEYRNDIVNMVLFGLDGTDVNENSRSDSIIILTVDFKNKKIKLSSLMRDMYVEIEGYGNTKLNHAYSYGGASLAIKTINQNFGTNIRDYIAIDFEGLEKIIDILGGVPIDLKQEEIEEIKISFSDEELTKTGEHLLNGKQALAYSRIRSIGNGDFDRTDRQRKVLYEIFVKAKDMERTSMLNLASEIFPLVETSMDKKTIINIASDYFKLGEMTFAEERFPIDGYHWNSIVDGIYYLKFDNDITKKQITDYIFYDVKPMPKALQ